MPRYQFKFSEDDGFTKDMVNLHIKFDNAVDSKSGHVEEAHVYLNYSAVLVHVDVKKDENSFYKLQVLQRDCAVGDSCWLFQSYGGVGAAGYMSCETEMSLVEATAKFHEVYQRLTGNRWANHFVPKPGKMSLLDIVYTPNIVENSRASGLAKPLRTLMRSLVRSREMKWSQIQTRDSTVWPLGVVAQRHIEEAREILDGLRNHIGTPNSVALSDRYYSAVPRASTSGRLRVLDTEAAIQEEQDFLDALPKTLKYVSSTDASYAELRTSIQPLDRRTALHKMIEQSARNTGGVQVEEIFTLERQGEHERYQKFAGWKNKKLLWHGSPLGNFFPILSQGLIIRSGVSRPGLFGVGIYFADMIAKSVPYCYVESEGDTSYGYALLCEVALGELDVRKSPCPSPPAPRCDSVFARGQTIPDPKGNMTKDGVVFATGRPGTSIETSQLPLPYNEYVVYDEGRVKMKYLVKFSMKHH